MNGWITEANKIGEYNTTYEGFRIYVVKEGRIESRIENIDDGAYQITDIIKGEFAAINKSGDMIMLDSIEALGYEIDFFNLIY